MKKRKQQQRLKVINIKDQKYKKKENHVSVRDKPYGNQQDDVDVLAMNDYQNNTHQCNSFEILLQLKAMNIQTNAITQMLNLLKMQA